MKFGGLQKTSLVDFPDKVSTVLFTVGCNLRCPYCHNWRLVTGSTKPGLTEDTVFKILESRRKQVDAVVVTGGEPTMQSDLPQFLDKLKAQGFAVKLDTNGFFPEVLRRCLPYVDYVALDVKTSPLKYHLLRAGDLRDYVKTVNMLRCGDVDYEFRSTVVPCFVDEADVPKMGELIRGAKRLIFQQFVSGDTLSESFKDVKPYTPEIIAHFAEVMRSYVDEVILRV